jgi:ELWxxDGT repeat protein
MEFFRRSALAVVLFVCASAFGGTPHLVRDINVSTTPVSSDPTDFIDQGSWSFLNAMTGSPLVYRIFATDGTSSGTVRLDSVNPLPGSATGYQTTKAGNLSYWFLSDGTARGYALWASDGTPAGTQVVMDFGALGNAGSPGIVFGNTYIFTVYETSTGKSVLWRSDGTATGTYRLTDPAGPNVNWSYAMAVVGQKLYFLNSAADGTVQPWVSDGTPAGTIALATVPNSIQDPLASLLMVSAGNYVLFNATTSVAGRELFSIDTGTNTLSTVANIAPVSATGFLSGTPLASLGNVAVFGAYTTGGSTYTLWRSDGTASGTFSLGVVSPVPDSLPGYSGVVGTFFVQPGATKAYFLGDDGQTGQQLYVTDGSTAGTLRLSTLSGNAYLVAAVGSSFYFGNTFGGQLWRSDGTLAGTHVVTGIPVVNSNFGTAGYMDVAGNGTTDFIRVQDDSNHRSLYRYDTPTGALTLLTAYSNVQTVALPRVFAYSRGQLFFDGDNPVAGHEPWVSDGTVAGTHLLRDLAAEIGNPSSPASFVEYNQKLYFSADDGLSGRELWTSDGTYAGTQLVIDINPGSAGSNPVDLFTAGGSLYFFTQPSTGASQFWHSDGTTQGTQMLATLTPLSNAGPGSTCGSGVALGNMVYFAAADTNDGTELWRTDGTSQGTTRVADINPGTASSNPCYLTVVGSRLYFAADGGPTQGGLELWASDGTAAGTVRVADIVAGSVGSTPHNLVSYNGLLYFLISDPVNGDQLWKSDGTAAGTVLVASPPGQFLYGSASLTSVNGRLVFETLNPAQTTPFPFQLWSFDGTNSTVLSPSVGMTPPGPLTGNGNQAYFAATATSTSYPATLQPWITDGTVNGTSSLTAGNSAFAGSNQLFFDDFNGLTLFQTNTAGGTWQLWRTDGSAVGTSLVGNIGFSSGIGSTLTHLTAGQNYFYVSDDGTTGAELFALDNASPLAAQDSGGTVTAGQSITINVLANDSDPDGSLDPSSIAFGNMPAGGTVSANSSGVVTYTARPDFSGTDSFIYSVADTQGARSSPAIVQITVVAPTSGSGSSGSGGSGGSGSSGGSGTGESSSSSGSKSGGGGGSLGELEIIALLAAAAGRLLPGQLRASNLRRVRNPH